MPDTAAGSAGRPPRARALWDVRDRTPSWARPYVRRAVDLGLAPVLGSWNRSTMNTCVALTLDDGPDPSVTPEILDRFAALDVRVTFFLLTLRAERFPRLVERIVDAGHEVALHGLDHRRVSTMPFGPARDYLAQARERLEQVASTSVGLFRPPYGSQSIASLRAARQAGLQVVVWNGDAADWEDRSTQDVLDAAGAACRPGGIVLFHERLEPDPAHPDPLRAAPVTTFDRPEVLARLVERLRERRLEPVSIGDLRRGGRLLSTVWLRP